MTRGLLAILTVGLLVTANAAADEVKKDLAKAVQKTAALESYRFTMDEQPGKGTGGSVEGKYQKGRPVFFRSDRIEFYQKGATLVYEQAGEWHKCKTGIQSDPLRILGASAKVRGARLPHAELAGFAKNFEKVRKAGAKENGHTVYVGDLSAAGVKKLAPSEFAGVARSGTGTLWVNAAGLVVKYTITLKLKGRRGNAEIDGSTTKTIKLADPGATRVEVPEAAQKILRKS